MMSYICSHAFVRVKNTRVLHCEVFLLDVDRPLTPPALSSTSTSYRVALIRVDHRTCLQCIMDDEDDPGAIPAVKHVEYIMDMEPSAPPPPVVLKRRIRDDSSETPFDETIKEEQLKELDDIVAMISVNTSPMSSIAPISPPPPPPPPTPYNFDPVEHHLPFSPIVHLIPEPSVVDDSDAPDDEPTFEQEGDRFSSATTPRAPTYLTEPIRYKMDVPTPELLHGEVSDASDGEHWTRSPVITRKVASPSPLRGEQPNSEQQTDERMLVSDEPMPSYQALGKRESTSEDDRSYVQSIISVDDDEDDDEEGEEDDEGIMEEIARECSPVSTCFTTVGTMAGEIYNSVEDNLLHQDSTVEADGDSTQKGETAQTQESETAFVVPNNDAIPLAERMQELSHSTGAVEEAAYATPYSPQVILPYPSEEGSMHQYPTEYDVTHSPLPAVPSLLGEDVTENEDVDTVDRELDFSSDDKEADRWQADEEDAIFLAPALVAGDESEPQSEAEVAEDEPSDEDRISTAESDAEATNTILSSAALSAALLGLGPGRSNRLSNVPQDERLAAPEGADPIDGFTTTSVTAEEELIAGNHYEMPFSRGDSLANSFLSPMDPEDVLLNTTDPKKYDMNISRDYTVGTDVNESRDEGTREEEHFIDEEQPPGNVKDRDECRESKGPRSWSRKCHILICIGLAVVVIIIAVSVVFGTKTASSSAVDTPNTGGGETGETRETEFSQLLITNSLADPALLSDESSSEYKAMNWIINEDVLRLDPTDSSVGTTRRITQRYSLATLYFASPVGQWMTANGWLNEDECTWFGIACRNGKVVTEIDIPGNNLTGTISAEIAQLSSLVRFVINGNQVEGEIPASMATMSSLQVVGLRLNLMDQGLSSFDFSMLTELEVFDVGENNFVGSIPSSMYSLTKLSYLAVDANRLSGTLSTKIGSLSNLVRLVLSGNSFVGSIPSEISELKLAKVFDVSDNDFSGPIPFQLEDMAELITFNANENKLKGNIPGAAFGSLSKLGTFVFLSLPALLYT